MIFITQEKSAISQKLINSLKQHNVSIFCSDNNINNSLPSNNDSAYSHKMLTFCLDFGIKVIIPTLNAEIIHLSKSKNLFNEYEIDIICPYFRDWQDIVSLNMFSNIDIKFNKSVLINTFEELASNLVKLNYPAKEIKIIPFENHNNSFRILKNSINNSDILFPNLERPTISYVQLVRYLKEDFQPIFISEHFDENHEIDCYISNTEFITIQHCSDKVNNFLHKLSRVIPMGCYRISYSEQNGDIILNQITSSLESELILHYIKKHGKFYK